MTQHPLTILVVDDSKANLRILSATFEDDGFRVYTASSVEEAQRGLLTYGNEIDLVLSDIQMPTLSGFDLLKWMKVQTTGIRDIPLLLITSQLPDTESRVLGLSLGAMDYLLRSLDTQELVLRVKHAIDNFKQLKNLKVSLETTESLASTGRLFAATNHEIKNVSQVIGIASGILERELGAEESDISDNCRQALKMLKQSSSLLLEVTKMIGGIVGNTHAPMVPVDIDLVVDQVAAMVKPLFKGGIDFKSNSKSSMWVQGSSTFIKQILINLLLNARDAIDEGKPTGGGCLTIRVSGTDDSKVEVSVMDNGSGFPVQEVRKEFLPFVSSKQLRGGTGLGLWLSSQLVEKMGGLLMLSSDGPGKGAEAKVILKKVDAK